MRNASMKAPAGRRAEADRPARASARAAPAPAAAGPAPPAATALAFASAGSSAPSAGLVRRKCAQCAAAEELEARTGVAQRLCPNCAGEAQAALQRRADGPASPSTALPGGSGGIGAEPAGPAPPTAPGTIYVGAADDAMECEAERAAERVMAGGHPPAPRSAGAAASLRRAGEGGDAGTAPPLVHAALAEGGRPLDPGTRAFMEAGFGRGFGGVRVHTGGTADASARAVRAQAYTVGSRLVFAAGRYRPETDEGRRLIAHELAHTVQQADGGPALQRVSDPVLLAPVRPNAQGCVVHVHGNEPVALAAAHELYRTRCVNLAWIDNPGERLIHVDAALSAARTITCRADPNRIFDNTALHNQWRSWNPTGPCSSGAGRTAGEAAVQAWRDARLNVAIRQCRGQAVSAAGVAGTGVSGGLPVLSMHNNTAAPSATTMPDRSGGGCRENLSIRSYLPGHCEAGATETDAARTRGHPNPQIADPAKIDEFVLVTDPVEWDRLVAAGTRNAVLQAASPTPDGSLSVAMAAEHYANVEVQQGGPLANNVTAGGAGLDALGVPAAPCAASTGAAAPVGGHVTPTLPTPAPGQITSAGVSMGSPDRTAFIRHVFDLQVAGWTAAGVPYTGSVSPLYTLRAADSLRAGTQLEQGVAQGSLEPMLAGARAALAAAKAAGTPAAAGVAELRVRSGYRSALEQKGIWVSHIPRYYEETAARRASLPGGEHGEAAARLLAEYANERVITPGYSPHQRAQTVDVTYLEGGAWAEADTSPAAVAAWRASWFFGWLMANAGNYGFRQNPALNEPWHWEHDPAGVRSDRINALIDALIDEWMRLLREWISGAAGADDPGTPDAPSGVDAGVDASPTDGPPLPAQPADPAPIPQ